jgi:hypothetical protein
VAGIVADAVAGIGFGLFVPFRKEGVEKQLKKTHRAEKSPP